MKITGRKRRTIFRHRGGPPHSMTLWRMTNVTIERLNAQLNRTRLSHDDFEEAGAYLRELEPQQSDVLRRGLLSAAIVAYVRPFTSNDRGSNGKATPVLAVRPKKILSDTEVALHEKLVLLRNEVVAHSQYDRKPVARVSGTQSGFTMQGKIFDLLAEKIDVALFRVICDAMRYHCFNTMLELNRKMATIENAP